MFQKGSACVTYVQGWSIKNTPEDMNAVPIVWLPQSRFQPLNWRKILESLAFGLS